MADQGVWFKLHCSALDDPDLDNLDVAHFGRWAKFGAFVKRHGTRGSIHIAAPARTLCAALQVSDFDALMDVISCFPHVSVRRDNDTVSLVTSATVTFDNWSKYQGDFSSPRVSKFREMKRSKRRGEEKRQEEKEKNPPTNPPTMTPNPEIPASIRQALERAPMLGHVPRLRTPQYWQALIRASNGLLPYADEILKAEAWLTANPSRAPRKDLARFLHNWLNRAAERTHE